MNTTNIICVKEDKEKLKKIWNNIVKTGVNIQQAKIKATPVTLKIASVFAPEAEPVLNSLADFLKTDAGKTLTEMRVKSYDMIGDVLTGNAESAKQKFSNNIKFLSGDSALKMIRDTSQFINEVGGRHL